MERATGGFLGRAALHPRLTCLRPDARPPRRSADPSFHSPYMRVSFSNASVDDLEEGMRRLGAVLRQHAAALGDSSSGGSSTPASSSPGGGAAGLPAGRASSRALSMASAMSTMESW